MILCKAQHAAAVNKNIFPGMQGGPLMHVIAAKAVAFHEALTPEWREYQRQIVANAKALAEALLGQGFRLVSGGTDTHVMLVDVASKGLTGKVAEAALDRAGITANKNTIPFETRPPTVTSGIRLGTPALTTRGMREAEMQTVAALIAEVLADAEDSARQTRVAAKVRELCAGFPLYPERLASS
jgi:glycine hydroxymethyltransferase